MQEEAMSNKKIKKYPIPTPTFQGKGWEYNTLILELLLTNGPQTAWELAKGIQSRRFGLADDSPEAKLKTQHIYSNLMKKNIGSLYRLREKGYIDLDEKTKKWKPCFKSYVLLAYNEDLRKKLKRSDIEFDFNDFLKGIRDGIEMIPFMRSMPRSIKNEICKNVAQKFSNTSTFERLFIKLLEAVKDQIADGLNLDEANEEKIILQSVGLIWTKLNQEES